VHLIGELTTIDARKRLSASPFPIVTLLHEKLHETENQNNEREREKRDDEIHTEIAIGGDHPGSEC
jgi:hypothetical protein